MTTRPPRNPQSGIALLMVLMALVLLTILGFELSVASRVDLRIARNARDRLQAHYLAESASRFALVRLYLYREVTNMKDGGGIPIPGLTPQLIDGIWSFPFPELPIKEMEKISWPGKFSSTVASEGSKIPVNTLDGKPQRNSSKELAATTKEQIKHLIEGMLEEEEFDKIYRGLKTDDLIVPLVHWVGGDMSEGFGQAEDPTRTYERADPSYKARGDRLPAVSELAMVAGWNDDLRRRIGQHFSVLNTRAEINPNYVTLERLRTFEPKLTPEDLGFIQKKRLETPFQSLRDLEAFIQTSPDIRNGKQFKFPEALKESMRETIFLVNATGSVGEVRRTIKLGVRFSTEAPKPSPNPDPSKPPVEVEESKKCGGKPCKLLEPQVITVEENA